MRLLIFAADDDGQFDFLVTEAQLGNLTHRRHSFLRL